MKKLLKSYKTEIYPTPQQIQKINQSLGICRWLYNSYIAKNKELYTKFTNGEIDKKQAFVSANNFDKYINNEIKILDEFKWINNCGSKARKKAICNAEIAYKNFFNGKSKFPRFKKKNRNNVKLYFPKNNQGDWKAYRHKIMIPTLKYVRLKEKGYIPINAKVISGTISKEADRYYVSVVCEIHNKHITKPKTESIGIDLGLKQFAICSNGKVYGNINKTSKVKKLEKKLKREQRSLSRKYENKKKGGATSKNISKQVLKIQKLHQRLNNIRADYINKIASELVEQNPSSITIEDLNVSGMMKNKHLSKAIQQQKFYEFRVRLTNKCHQNKVELRVVDRFFPSSKMCNCCGNIKRDLKLSDRIYKCECGYEVDRDFNASLNLKDATIYTIA